MTLKFSWHLHAQKSKINWKAGLVKHFNFTQYLIIFENIRFHSLCVPTSKHSHKNLRTSIFNKINLLDYLKPPFSAFRIYNGLCRFFYWYMYVWRYHLYIHCEHRSKYWTLHNYLKLSVCEFFMRDSARSSDIFSTCSIMIHLSDRETIAGFTVRRSRRGKRTVKKWN